MLMQMSWTSRTVSRLYFIVCVVTSSSILVKGQTDAPIIPSCHPPAEVGSPYTFSHVFNESYTDGIKYRYNNTRSEVKTVAFCFPVIESGHPRCLNYTSRLYVASVHWADPPEYYRVNLTIKAVTSPRDDAVWAWSVGHTGRELGKCQLLFYSLPKVSITGCVHESDPRDGYIKAGTTSRCSCRITDLGLPPGKAFWLRASDGHVMSEGVDYGGPATLNVTFDPGDPHPSFLCHGRSTYGAGLNVTYTPTFAYGPDNVNISVKNDTSSIDICPQSSTSSSSNSSLSSSSLSSSIVHPLVIEIYCDTKTSLIYPGLLITLNNNATSPQQQQQKRLQRSEMGGDAKGDNSTINYVGDDRFVFQYELPEEGGVVHLECVATNSIYSDIQAMADTEIVVRAPPTKSPTFSIINDDTRIQTPITTYGGRIGNNNNNNNDDNDNDNDRHDDVVDNEKIVYSVIEGQALELTCIVEGGYPDVFNTSIECVGSATMLTSSSFTSSPGHRSRLSLGKISQNFTATRCTCSASHVTGCYDRKTEVVFNVQYPASIVDFQALTNRSVPDIKAGMTVTLTCNVTGNPLPEDITIRSGRVFSLLSLVDQGQMETEDGDGWREIRLTKVFHCEDTDVYMCTAANGIGSGTVTREVTLPVICPPELQSTSTDAQLPSFVTSGNRVYFDLPVRGHPKPYEFTLTKQSQCPSNTSNGTALTFVEVSPSLYNAIYLPATDPSGNIRLDMTLALTKDVGVYRLAIGNGIQPDLEHTFYLGTTASAETESDVNTDDDEDDNKTLIIAVVVAIAVIVATNIIVAFIFYSLGKRTERKQEEFRKREPKVQYVASSAGHQNGGFQDDEDHSNSNNSPPSSPGAYTNIDFVRLDHPVSNTASSSDDDNLNHRHHHQQQHQETARIPPPRPPPLSTTTTTTTPSSNRTRQNPHQNNNSNNNNNNNNNNNSHHSPRQLSAQTPPGNFYTYDLPKTQSSNPNTNNPSSDRQQINNNVNNPNSIYANSDTDDKQDGSTSSDYERLKNSQTNTSKKKSPIQQTVFNKIPPIPTHAVRGNVYDTYQEITPIYSDSSENKPINTNSKFAADSSSNVYYQIPSNLEQGRDIARHNLSTGSNRPIAESTKKNYLNESTLKSRKESDASDDIYQQIDVDSQPNSPLPPTSDIPDLENESHGLRGGNPSPQRLNSRPVDLPLRLGHDSSFSGDNLFKYDNDSSNSNDIDARSDVSHSDRTDTKRDKTYANDATKGNKSRLQTGTDIRTNKNNEHLNIGASNYSVSKNNNNDMSPKYEDASSIFRNVDSLEGDSRNDQQKSPIRGDHWSKTKRTDTTTDNKLTSSQDGGVLGESEYENLDNGDNNLNKNNGSYLDENNFSRDESHTYSKPSPKYEDPSSVFAGDTSRNYESGSVVSKSNATPIYAKPFRSYNGKAKEGEEEEDYSHYVMSDSERISNEPSKSDPKANAVVGDISVLSTGSEGYYGDGERDIVDVEEDMNHYVLPSPVQDATEEGLGDSESSTYANTQNVDGGLRSTIGSSINRAKVKDKAESDSSKRERGYPPVVPSKSKWKKPRAGAYEEVDLKF